MTEDSNSLKQTLFAATATGQRDLQIMESRLLQWLNCENDLLCKQAPPCLGGEVETIF